MATIIRTVLALILGLVIARGGAVPAPTLWHIMGHALTPSDAEGASLAVLAWASLAGATAALLAWTTTRPWRGPAILTPVFLAALLVAQLAPGAGSDALLPPLLLAAAHHMIRRDRASHRIAALVWLATLLAPLAPLAALAALATATRRTLAPLLIHPANDNHAPLPRAARRIRAGAIGA